jgi:hypothetical protein
MAKNADNKAKNTSLAQDLFLTEEEEEMGGVGGA